MACPQSDFEKGMQNEIRDGLKAAGPVDGVLLLPFTARWQPANAVRSEEIVEACGRQAVGKDVPINGGPGFACQRG